MEKYSGWNPGIPGIHPLSPLQKLSAVIDIAILIDQILEECLKRGHNFLGVMFFFNVFLHQSHNAGKQGKPSARQLALSMSVAWRKEL